MSNASRLRSAVRAAKLPPEDAAGAQLAAQLAELLDRAAPITLTRLAAGDKPLSLEDALTVVKVCGPLYLRTLTALGLTKAGRAVMPASSVPTAGSAAGAAQDAAAHDRHRQRFSERATG